MGWDGMGWDEKLLKSLQRTSGLLAFTEFCFSRSRRARNDIISYIHIHTTTTPFDYNKPFTPPLSLSLIMEFSLPKGSIPERSNTKGTSSTRGRGTSQCCLLWLLQLFHCCYHQSAALVAEHPYL